MDDFLDFNDNEKKSFVSLLIQLSEADNEYNNNEIALIKSVGLNMGLSVDDIKKIKHSPDSFQFEIPDNINQRMQMFYYLLFMMRIDGKVSTNEKNLLKKIGFKLCLNPPLMEELMNIIEQHKSSEIPDKIIIETVRKYLN